MTFTRRRFLQLSGAATAIPLLRNVSLAERKEPSALCQKLAADPLRPQYHLLPASNWMNDPNGPIYFRGRYHMFYQYNPKGAVWGNMNWAHSSSSDMVYWRHEPIAISPSPSPKGFDSLGVFSGSAILDRGLPTMIYTGVMPPASDAEITLRDDQHQWREVQCLAVSHDPDLRTWEKVAEPAIAAPPEGMEITGFRDPSAWREGNSWLLALGSGIRGKAGAILLYESSDLRHWTYLHPLFEGVPKKDVGDMWECPDFFPLDGKHVLLVSTEGKVHWRVGTYKDRRFSPEKEGVADWGAFYAAKSMVNEDDERILWGWIPEKRPEAEHNAAGWAGVMSLPRLLSINSDGELQMEVVPALRKLRHGHTGFKSQDGPDALRKALDSIRIEDLSAEISAEFHLKTDQPFTLHLRSEDGERFAAISCVENSGKRLLKVNDVAAPLHGSGALPIRLEVFLDGSVLEVIASGTTALTARVYTVPKWPLQVSFDGDGQVDSLDVWRMHSISKDRLTGSLCG